MPMTPIPWDYLQENLVTQSDIARRLKVDRANVTNWKNQHDDWPAPRLTISSWSARGGSDLYWWPDIEAFCQRHGIRPGQGMRPGRRSGTRLSRDEAAARDREITARAAAGEDHGVLAAEFGLSRQRIGQIVNRPRLPPVACRFYPVGWGISPHTTRRTHARRGPC